MTIAWDLGSLVSYEAGAELEVAVEFDVPEDATYYLIGALYTTELAYIAGTMFGVLVPTGEDYGVNSPGDQTAWEMVADEEKELDCKFTLGQTNVILGLFLVEQLGDDPDWATDTVVSSITTSLSGTVAPTPSTGIDIDINSMMNLMITMMIVVMMMKMMTGAADSIS